jgi:hypothetical protein
MSNLLRSRIEGVFDTIHLTKFGAVEASILFASGIICYVLVRRLRRPRATPLRGPPSNNFFFGVLRQLMNAPDAGALYEEWAQQYGSVYMVPSLTGTKRLVFTDPKSIAHFFARETFTYVQTPQSSRFLEKMIGRGLFWAEGESHKRWVLLS